MVFDSDAPVEVDIVSRSQLVDSDYFPYAVKNVGAKARAFEVRCYDNSNTSSFQCSEAPIAQFMKLRVSRKAFRAVEFIYSGDVTRLRECAVDDFGRVVRVDDRRKEKPPRV